MAEAMGWRSTVRNTVKRKNRPRVCRTAAAAEKRHLTPEDVTAGCGWTQCEGEPVVEILAGDVIWCPPNHKHWHGATHHVDDPHRHPGSVERQGRGVDGARDRRKIAIWSRKGRELAGRGCLSRGLR